MVGLDASIIMHPKIWEASGHVNTFVDLMVECKLTRKRYRVDQVEPRPGEQRNGRVAVPALVGRPGARPIVA